MNGRARDLNALFKCRLVHAEAVIALAAERGDERRMNVQDAVFKFFVDLFVNYCEEACKYD